MNISTDKPDNHFLSLSLEEDAIFITGDKLALEFAKANNIKAASPSDFIKRIKWLKEYLEYLGSGTVFTFDI